MFREWPKDRFVRHLEGQGRQLRQRLRLGDLEMLDPRRLVTTYPNMTLLDLAGVIGHEAELETLKQFSAKWSALAYREAGGVWLIVWNPWHAATRTRVSLMEEVAHIALGHKPTKLVPDPIVGLPRRTYSPSKEKEAYGVAGAALVPYNGMMDMLERGKGRAEIAIHYQVSDDLVRMRMQVTGARRAEDSMST